MGDRPKRLVTYVDPPLEERLAEAMEREGFKARSEFLRTALKEKVDRVLRVMPAFLPLLPSDASVYIALALLLTALAAYYAVRLVRAESPEEQARAQTVIAGCVLGGAIMVLAKPLANWVFGIDFDNPPATLPADAPRRTRPDGGQTPNAATVHWGCGRHRRVDLRRDPACQEEVGDSSRS